MRASIILAGAVLPLLATPAQAQSARDLIFQSAFGNQNQPVALERVRRAQASAAAIAQRDPNAEDAVVMVAAAQGYIAKLTGNRSEALKARGLFNTAATRFPRNAEAQLGMGAWHLSVVHRAGRLLGAVIGANKGKGIAGLTRAVTLGRDRAFIPSVAGMMLIESDPNDAQGRSWLELAARTPAPTAPDRVVQRAAGQVLQLLRTGDTAGAARLADRSLPFGWFQPKD